MSIKCTILVTKFQKSSYLQYWWPEVSWFGQMVVWRHHHYVTKITSQNFFPIWAPPNQNFWLCQWSWVNNLTVFKKSGLSLGLVT